MALELTDDNGTSVHFDFLDRELEPLFFTVISPDSGAVIVHLNRDQLADLAAWFQRVATSLENSPLNT